MFRFILIFLFLSNFVLADDFAETEADADPGKKRPSMHRPSEDEVLVQKLLEKVKSAVVEEDLRIYFSCFSKDSFSRNKNKIVTLFMSSDLDMEIHKFELIESNDDFVEFFVNYTWYEDSLSYKVVSSITADKKNGSLIVSREKILSKKEGGNNNSAILATNAPINPIQLEDPVCRNGNCGPKKKYIPKFDENGYEILEGISMFNDENGNPSKNGIMWLDPAQLWRKFPDKYGVPKCARIKMGIE